jgi:hypothetical protein
METAPAKLIIEDVENLKLNIETHSYTCIKYEHDADNGFSGNLALLLEAIEHSDKVKCEGIKLIAKGILKSVIHHKVINHDMNEVNKNLMKYRESEEEKIRIKEDLQSN